MLQILSPERFFLEVAPYEKFEIGNTGHVDLLRIQYFTVTLDTFCTQCGRETVFASLAPSLMHAQNVATRRDPDPITVDEILDDKMPFHIPYQSLGQDVPPDRFVLSQLRPLIIKDRLFHVSFECTRNSAHQLHFYFQIQSGQIEKIGQSPSLADLHLSDLRRYRKLLGDEKYREFARGVGLHAHGIGIGSFVYLRRILVARRAIEQFLQKDLLDQGQADRRAGK